LAGKKDAKKLLEELRARPKLAKPTARGRRAAEKRAGELGVTAEDFARLDADREAKAHEVETASGKARQALLVPAKKDFERVPFEVWRHPDGAILRRKVPDTGSDPLLSKGTNLEERMLKLAKALKGVRSVRAAEAAAKDIMKCLEDGRTAVKGMKYEDDEVVKIVFRAGWYFVSFTETAWAKKKESIQNKLIRKERDTDAKLKGRREEIRGKIRLLVQNAMRKADKKKLVRGAEFEGAFVELYAAVKRDLYPGDDEGPRGEASIEVWERAAFAETAPKAQT